MCKYLCKLMRHSSLNGWEFGAVKAAALTDALGGVTSPAASRLYDSEVWGRG
jgi:hypothetical protein